MDILDSVINKHTNAVKSVLFGHNGLLSESKQLIPNIHTYYDIVWKKVSVITGVKGDDDFLKENNKEYQISINESDFEDVETFFKRLSLRISLTLTNKLNTYEYSGGYMPQVGIRDTQSGKIVALCDGEKLPIVKINGYITTSVSSIQEAIAALVYHEFTHAYEDFRRIKMSGKLNSMAAYTVHSKYGGINAIRNSDPKYGIPLGHTIYLLKQIEKNAYVAQAIGEIEVLSLTNWADNLPEAIKKTKGYENYETLLQLISKLEDVQDESAQQRLLSAYNNNAGIIGAYNGTNKKYSFRTYNQMVKWLKKKSIYSYNMFIEKLARHFEDTQIRNKFTVK